MRAVALGAVTYRWRVNSALQIGCILIGVAGNAQGLRRRCGEFDPGYILVDSNLVTSGASSGNRGVNDLALTFVFMARDALSGIGVLIERDRMNSRV